MLCFSSCLDEHPKDQLDQEAIYNNADNIYKNAVASLYNYIGSNQESEGLQGTCRGIYDYNTLTTDEAMIPIRGGDWYDGGLWENMYQHKWTANDINLYNVWKYLFKVIVISNQSLSFPLTPLQTWRGLWWFFRKRHMCNSLNRQGFRLRNGQC